MHAVAKLGTFEPFQLLCRMKVWFIENHCYNTTLKFSATKCIKMSKRCQGESDFFKIFLLLLFFFYFTHVTILQEWLLVGNCRLNKFYLSTMLISEVMNYKQLSSLNVLFRSSRWIMTFIYVIFCTFYTTYCMKGCLNRVSFH